jgi:hypothetical protein
MNGLSSTVSSGSLKSSVRTNLFRANMERSITVNSRLLDACLPALTAAADAQHLAAEFVCRYLHQRRQLPALALNANSSAATAIGNDYGYEEVFARQIEALAGPGDVAVAISTSGSSPSVVHRRDVRQPPGLVHDRAHRGLRRPTVRACECAYRCAIPRDATHTGMSYPRSCALRRSRARHCYRTGRT